MQSTTVNIYVEIQSFNTNIFFIYDDSYFPVKETQYHREIMDESN